jgi:mRNA-degrading endonuclease HigB of HigAB toxin-antitoxin module
MDITSLLNGAFEVPQLKTLINDITAVEMPLVHREDLLPVNLIKPSVHGPWIAGGSALQWYQSQPLALHDIDIFCAGPEQADQLCQLISQYGHSSFVSNNATTFTVTSNLYNRPESPSKTWRLQVIKKRYFDNPADIIDSFDITVCQVVFDGDKWYLGPSTARDIRQQNLRMTFPLAPDAIKRLTKYWSYGYRPVSGLLNSIVNQPEIRWQFNPSEDYDNAL